MFIVTGVDLGPLKKLRIRHDNSKSFSSWYLDRVEIVDTKDDTVYVKLAVKARILLNYSSKKQNMYRNVYV